MAERGWPVQAGWVVVYLAAHLLAAEWAFAFAGDDSVLLWYPPAGLGIAAVILGGRRFVGVVVLAEVLSTWLVSGFASAFGPFWLVVNGAALALGWWVAAEVFWRTGGAVQLRRPRDVLSLVAGCLVAGPLVASALGIAVQVQIGLLAGGDALREAALFWIGDVVGVAALTPSLLIAGAALSGRWRPVSELGGPRRLALLAVEVLVPVAVVASLLIFTDTPTRFLYLVAVPMVVIAVHHGVVGAAVAGLGLCSVAVAIGAEVATETVERSDLQLLVVAAALLALLLGAVETQRRDLRAHREELSRIVEASPDLIATATRWGDVLYCNAAGRRMLGVGEDEPMVAWDFVDGPNGRAQLAEAVRSAEREGIWTGEATVISRDGHRIEVAQVFIGHPDADGVVRRLSTQCHDITAHRRLEDELSRNALYDELTGQANRALLIEQLERALRASEGGPVVLALADIVRFRDINESLGFAAGDQVLATVASRLADGARPRQLVARYGADTFAVLDEGVTDEYDALTLGSDIARRVREPLRVDGHELVLDVSVGAVLVTSAWDPLDCLRQAEIALSRSKETRGRFALFNPEMDRRARDRVLLENDLRRAIDSDEWTLEYQPVVDLESDRIVACEALFRWDHPDRGRLATEGVVAMAEATGLIVRLGRRVLEEACRRACSWHAAGHDVSVAVNVSGRQLAEPTFTSDVAGIFAATGVVPEKVVLEVTESALVSQVPGAPAALERLRSLGCEVAIDDFGAGFASFASLRDLPIDILKLDRSFLTDLTTSHRVSATVEGVIGMANALGVRVIAEGVEETDQLEQLRRIGCHQAQGYLLARPMPAELLTPLLTH